MMFVCDQKCVVRGWPAIVTLPDDGGHIKKEPITLDFQLQNLDGGVKILSGDMELFKSTIIGWSGICTADGNELTFNEVNKSLLFKNTFFIASALKAYQQAANGLAANDD